VTVKESTLEGWVDFHWRDLVLIGTSPVGVAWSLGEAVLRTGSGETWRDDNQRLQSAYLLGPTGSLLRIWSFDRPDWPNRPTVWRRVCRAVVELGGTLREGPWA
jgi:hypothetical protein